nr:hypothetical protein [Chloroflexota bacterium]
MGERVSIAEAARRLALSEAELQRRIDEGELRADYLPDRLGSPWLVELPLVDTTLTTPIAPTGSAVPENQSLLAEVRAARREIALQRKAIEETRAELTASAKSPQVQLWFDAALRQGWSYLRRNPPIAVALVVFLILVAAIPQFMVRLDPFTGDEPSYIMTSISLIEDFDINEQNNYDNQDFRRFYPEPNQPHNGWGSVPDPLPPHAAISVRPGLYSWHGLGLAVIAAVPYALGGRALLLMVLAVIAALLAFNMTLLAARYTRSTSVAVVVALLFALSNPIASFSLLVFPEMSAALAVTYATRRLLEPRNRWWQWLLIGACAAVLPWLNFRFVIISASLALVAYQRHWRILTNRERLAAGSVPAVLGLLLVIFHYYLYGQPTPGPSSSVGFSGFAGTMNGLAGTFLDQQWGAFIHNPLLFLAVVCFVPFAIRLRRDAATLALVALPYLAIIASYEVWWGEWNPPARYLTSVVPLAVPGLAWFLSQMRGGWRWLLVAAFSLPAFAVIRAFAADPQRMYNHPDGTSNIFELWSASSWIHWTELVPSYVFYSASPIGQRQAMAFAWLALFITLSVVAWLVVARQSTTDLSRSTLANQEIPAQGRPGFQLMAATWFSGASAEVAGIRRWLTLPTDRRSSAEVSPAAERSSAGFGLRGDTDQRIATQTTDLIDVAAPRRWIADRSNIESFDLKQSSLLVRSLMRVSDRVLAIGSIALVGFVYLFQLGSRPFGVFCDEVLWALKADALVEGTRPEGTWLLFTDHFGYVLGSLPIFAEAPWVWLFGLGEFSVRFSSVVYMFATFGVLYLMLRRLRFTSPWLPVLMFAFTPIVIHMSRINFGHAPSLFLIALGYYLYLLGRLKGRGWLSIAGGFATGISAYGYTGFYIATIVFIGLVVISEIAWMRWPIRRHLLIWTFAALLCYVPIVMEARNNPA